MASKLLLMLVLATVAVTNVVGQRNIALSGPEIRSLALGQNPDLLARAALTGESVIIVIDGPETIAPVQENVNANFWCLPWLQRFPGGSIRWLFQSRDPTTGEANNLLGPVTEDASRIIGGTFNEWFNITATILVQGAASPSSGLYICEVCRFRNTPFEECHLANTSLQVLGDRPILDDTEDNTPIERTDNSLVYRIGSDFCIDPNYRGTITIRCGIANFDVRNDTVSRAFPTPDRSWSLNDDLLYRTGAQENPNLRENPEFYMASDIRMLLSPDFFVPPLLTTPTGIDQGALLFNFELINASAQALMMLESFNNIGEARVAAPSALVGDWTCQANNSFGADSATSSIRICGAAPNVQRCSSTLFSVDSQVIPVGCVVCIPEGARITLNCSGQSESDVSYEWRNGMGRVVSTSPLLTTGTNDNFTCTATNLDNAPEIAVSVVAYSDDVTFTHQTTEEFRTTPRRDSGCSRLSDQMGLEGVALCAFVGETLGFNCYTDDRAMNPLEISGPNNVLSIGNLTVANVDTNSEGTYRCRLNTDSGPCGQATVDRMVRVFDPATISRTSTLPEGCIGAGRATGSVFRSVSTEVTLCCPYNGIEVPTREWYRIVVNELGCATEELVLENESTTFLDDGNVLSLTVTLSEDVTYVCRVSNRAGRDADIVSFRTSIDQFVWSVTDFSDCDVECRDGVRRRSVVCRNSRDQMIVRDTECTDVRPADTMSCANEFPDICLLDPAWFSEAWSQCSRDCGGYRMRENFCRIPMTLKIVPSYRCGQTEPRWFDTEGCRKCCTGDQNLICKQIGKAGCGDESFRNRCCWTCGLKYV